MNHRVSALQQYSQIHSVEETAKLVVLLLGLDAESGWKTNENGKHYKIGKGGTVVAGPKAMVGNNVNQERIKARPRESKVRNQFEKRDTKRASRVGYPVDVTEEYKMNARPGQGKVTKAPGYDINDSPKGKQERECADWLVATFGGNLTLNKQKNQKGEKDEEKKPEYTWDGKYWEYKEPEQPTITAMKNNMHDGLRQIKNNPGGIVMDITRCGASFELAEAGIYARARQSAHFPVDVIILKKGDAFKVLRFTPE